MCSHSEIAYICDNQQLNFYKPMRKLFSTEEYVAPEMEVVATAVESGFAISGSIDLADEYEIGEL